ncbi:MAG: hypothetical protein PHY02_11080 [Phycisphaerae bacterium]|nr:hypothetical protein [Phycisphaerae bacterium]
MIKKTGVALIGVLIVILGIAAVTGILQQVWPAAQPSPTAQKLIAPTEKVKTGWFTTLGKLKDQKVELDVIAATTTIVQKEFEVKIAEATAAYSVIAAIAGAYVMGLYKNQTMYSEDEHKLGMLETKNGGGTTV